MKSYFAKFLPVGGEIKVGDNTLETLTTGEKMLWHIDTENDIDIKNQVKVKLFLCSRDIQLGEEVSWINGNKVSSDVPSTQDFLDSALENDVFKVVGEISPGAIWVREKDEFSEEEVLLQYIDEDGNWYTDKGAGAWTGYAGEYKNGFLIKCSMCATFH